jgi:hypothetical protein
MRPTRRTSPNDISEELKPGESLIQRANRLRRAAHEVLDNQALIRLLETYGRPKVVGSVALGLMVWRDIDIEVEVAGEIDESDVWAAARQILSLDAISVVSVADDRSGQTTCRVPSMYVGARYWSKASTVWKIDIRFVRSADAIASEHLQDLGSRLTPETRLRILTIKDTISKRPEYGTAVSGMDVYRAVLFGGVEHLMGFDAWLLHRDALDETHL